MYICFENDAVIDRLAKKPLLQSQQKGPVYLLCQI